MRVVAPIAAAALALLVLAGCGGKQEAFAPSDKAEIQDNFVKWSRSHIRGMQSGNPDLWSNAAESVCPVLNESGPEDGFLSVVLTLADEYPSWSRRDRWLFTAAAVTHYCPDYYDEIPQRSDYFDAE